MTSKSPTNQSAILAHDKRQRRWRQLLVTISLIGINTALPPAARTGELPLPPALFTLRATIISLASKHRGPDAISVVNKYKSCHKLDEAYYAAVAEGFEDGRDFNQAIKTLNEGLKAYPNSFALRYTEARTWLDVAEGEKAETDLKLCARIRPKSGLVHAQVARVSLSRGEVDKALSESNRAVALEPQEVDVWSIRCSVLSDAGRYKEAAAAMDKAISLCGSNILLTYPLRKDRAQIREKLGQYQGAIDDYMVFLRKDNFRNPRCLTGVGNCYMQLKQPQKALPYFDQCIARDPSKIEAHRGKLAALQALNQTEAAAREKNSMQDSEADFSPPK